MVGDAELESALREGERLGRTLGEVLVEKGLLSESQFTQVISKLLSVPWVSLYHVQFTRELLNLIPAELADRHCVVPVYTRTVRKGNAVLYIAMQDPSDVKALDQIREAAHIEVKPMIAPPSEIRRAIDVYYFGRGPQREEVSERITPISEGSVTERNDVVLSRGWSAPPRNEVFARAATPRESKKTVPRDVRMVTLTLLDGTTMTLPAAGGSAVQASGTNQSLTATDLIDALNAHSQGMDVSEILPEVRWEQLFGTLLTLLIRKGFIADWEFIEEWTKKSE
ncbi:MAG: hypothetical protein H6714_07925 [Myxococcales bacterium]|nr:hypothetical protein [Myxococcales bacterium]